jgi:type I restriction enzyme R subunit
VIWHTTGSGKSNLMVILSRALLIDPDLAGCRVIVVTDRVDLERQLSGTFLSGGAFGSEIASKVDGERSRAQSGRDLALRIGQGEERIIFTLLQKFTSATKLPECRNTSDKLIVLVDEGHRSQGGENHERMRMALPNAAFIAFTGTPLLKEDKTRNKFGPILHAYTMARAVEDGAVTPLIYEERRPKLSIDEVAVDAWFEKHTADLSEAQKSDLKRKYATRGEVYKAERRIELIAEDIAEHFSRNVAPDGLKAQLATDSKMSAIRYKAALDRTGKVTSAVVISAPDTREGHDDTDETRVPELQKWWTDTVGADPEGYEKRILGDFATAGAPEILIVVDKLLTGFDEPSNAVLYIDKNLKSHNLLQAIARVNRLHDAKKFGYLVDYRGILAELDVSIQDYQDLAAETESGFEAGDLVGTVTNVAMEYKRLPGLHDALWAIFKGVKNRGDAEQLRRFLMPQLVEDDAGLTHDENQKRREDFYAALTEFGMCLKLALSSRAFFEDGAFSEQQIRAYKKDLTFFTAIRQQARQDAQETVDFSKYEDQIRRLVDRQVNGQEIVDPEGVILLSDLGARDDDPESWNDEKTRTEADLIKTRMRKTIEQDLGDDPFAQKVFSDLLKQAIAAADALFDHPYKQFTMLKDLEDQIAARKTPGIPDRFGDNRHAQAFFGAVLGITKSEGTPDLTEDAIVAEAFAIDAAVEAAIRTHSLSPANIEAEISKTLLTRFYRLLGGLDQAQALVATVIGIVRAGRAKTGT